jgi:DNA-binding transcriptional regulator YiaG
MADWFKRKDLPNSNDEIDQLTQTINEQSSEQRKLMNTFNKSMNNFATERSLETCLEALNTSMQIANIRGNLLESYKHYARLLEREITRLDRFEQKMDKPKNM